MIKIKGNAVPNAFRAQVKTTPENIAIKFRNTALTYDELDRRSNRVANYLIKRGVKKGDLVAFVLERSTEMIEIIFGIIKTGAAYVPIDPSLPEERIEFILNDSGAKVVLTISKYAEQLPKSSAQLLNINNTTAEIAAQSAAAPRRSIHPNDLIYIIYTSGSTGKPKGVMVAHRGLVNLAKNMGFVDYSQPQTFLLQTQISFDVSGYEIYSALLNGATLAIAEPQKPTPDSVIAAVKRYDVTVLSLTTGLFHFIVDERVQDLAPLRHLIAGGDVMLPHLAEKATRELPNTTVINGYGPTENSIYTTAYAIPRGHHFIAGVPIGSAVTGTQSYVLDTRNRPVKKGQTGELVAGGPGVALGYWHRPDITAERFIQDPASNDPDDKLYKTGDLVRETPGGYEFLGRIDQQVKIRGFRIELGDIENTILKSPEIQFCAVTAQEFTPGDKRLMAHIVPREKEAFSLSTFKSFLADHLPEYMLPAHFVVMDKLPMNASGKVDRKALPQTVERPDLAVAYQAPQTDLEKQITAIFRDLLGVQDVGIHDNFFDLGGNSMLAARATVRLQKLFSKGMSASVVYDKPTVSQLAQLQDTEQVAQLDLAAEVQLDQSVQPKQAFNLKQYKQRNVLLTGATGFLGAYLIRELFQKKQIQKIYCLVRASNADEGLKRIKLNMDKYLLWDEAYAQRIVPICGHLERENLGLTTDEYNQLAQQIDTIYHNGAKVNYIQSYDLHKAANVVGTQNILAFAATHTVKPVHFLSTIVSFGPLGFLSHVKTIYEEDDLDRSEHVLYHDMGYAQSKWVAEKVVLEARRRGIPSTILRPGFIMGETTRGINNTDDFVARMIKGCIRLGAYPYLPKQRKEFTPVDYVARTILHITSSPNNLNRAYHLVPPHQQSVDLDDFFVAVRDQFGYDIKQIPFTTWAQTLADSNDAENPLTTFLPLFFEKTYKNRTVWELYENMSAYDSTNVQAALKGSNITCPKFDSALLKKYFDYMIDIGFIPPAPSQEMTTENDQTVPLPYAT